MPGAGQQDSTPRRVPQEHRAHSGHPCSHCRLKPKHPWKASALCRLQRQTTLQVACQSASQGSLRPGDPDVGWFPREGQSREGACPALQTHPPGWASPPTLCTHSTPCRALSPMPPLIQTLQDSSFPLEREAPAKALNPSALIHDPKHLSLRVSSSSRKPPLHPQVSLPPCIPSYLCPFSSSVLLLHTLLLELRALAKVTRGRFLEVTPGGSLCRLES